MASGFKLGATVIDRKTLSHAGVKLVSGFAALYTVLLALKRGDGDEPAGFGADECELSTKHVGMMRLMLADRNASCAYNMTVGQVLAGV